MFSNLRHNNFIKRCIQILIWSLIFITNGCKFSEQTDLCTKYFPSIGYDILMADMYASPIYDTDSSIKLFYSSYIP